MARLYRILSFRPLNILRAIKSAQANKAPVIVVQHDAPEESPVFAKGSDGWQLHPAIEEVAADHRINKILADVFLGTDLKQWLSSNNINTLTIAGYMTHNCNASTIYHAAHEGYKVEYLSDATGALSYENAGGRASAEEIHRVFSTVFHSNFASVVTTEEWIDAVNAGSVLAPDNIYMSNLRTRTPGDSA